MGVVYVAHDTQLGRRVAVKVLRNQSGPAEARLLREAQVMARLAHPNVVVLYDAGMVAGQMFIAMELVEGETLAAWLERRHSWQEVLERFLQSGRGLAAAHASGIVHRDFKPANVLVGTDGRARVLDFGVAREASELGTSPAPVHEGGPGALTETGTILGTPAYMAPEQRRGERATEASDQFSFCVSLWEGLAGARPGDTPRTLAGPTALRRVVQRGLQDDPAARWPSMTSLLDALRAAARARRRAATILVTALAATAIAIGALRPQSPASGRCAPARDRLSGVWDAATKSAMRAAFRASRLSYADHQWQTVEDTIDRYASEWSTQSDRACIATDDGSHAPSSLARQRLMCLDRELDHLRSWVNVFVTSDAELVRGAALSAASLDDLALCNDPAEAVEPLPNEPVLSAQVAVLRGWLASETVRASAGQYKQAVAEVQRILAAARALGYRPLIAESLAVIAVAEDNADDFKAALATWLELRDAAEETHQDRQRGKAWSGVAFAYSNLFQYEKGHDAVRVATAILRPLSGRTAETLRADLDSHEASIYWGEGQLERAAELYRKVETAEIALFGPDSYRLGSNELNLGSVLAKMGRYDEADEVLALALRRYLAANGDSHPAVSRIVNNQGDILFWRGDYAGALERFREALAIKDRAGLPADNLGRAYTLLNIGEALVHLKKADEAADVLHRARGILSTKLGEDNEYFAELLTWSGLAALGQGRAREAIAPLERALEILRRSSTTPVDLADAELGLARALWDARPTERARAHQLAAKARDALAVDPRRDRDRADADVWLATHALARPR
jgi:serine/threonine protein kinase/Tfp pilus assembly protein PilF